MAFKCYYLQNKMPSKSYPPLETVYSSTSIIISQIPLDNTFFFFFGVAEKMARLKQAKDEAEREVAQYRAHMEAQYQNKLSEVIFNLNLVSKTF